MDHEEFEKLVAEGLDSVPEEFLQYLENVAVIVEDNPTFEQVQKLKLRPYSLLFGLYEGVSLKGRALSYNTSLPDKITIFKHPLVGHSSDLAQLKANIKHTLWHEIAHHYGLGHDRIHELERKAKQSA